MRVKLIIFNTIIWMLATGHAFAQNNEILVTGHFTSDSVKIGEPIGYSLSVTYPESDNILYPDSLNDFSPFEYIGKKYFKTIKDGALTKDSVVYELMTFSTDSIQSLSMPVYLLTKNDSIPLYGDSAYVHLKRILPVSTPQDQLKSNTSFLTIKRAFNFGYLYIFLGIFFVLAVVIALVFGKKIKNKYLIYRLKKRHEKFIIQFDALKSKSQENSKNAEKTLNAWKLYIEKLSDQPYSKLTTKEITNFCQDDIVSKCLAGFDQYIYGGIMPDNFDENIEGLKDFANELYNTKLEEVNNG
ncbi:hypothetical protein [Aureibacter tunicatorum]|uniref:Protein BatD n=1 Tax=Aureibacter tunicatorum TaxID=866807 RepID=A0AAE3XR98_9BACT|nr:hypothetical protein [Aureibacter tunicatorum]MDR6241220.1 hypothetical protein [Aureibacter tunicatorum]BDD03481.1 hypothetical protein AUTU_09640 [Aureibacter tunicatorum]